MTPNLNKALRAFQMEMVSMETNARGHQSSYANIGGVINAVRPAAKFGLSYTQGTKHSIDGKGDPYMVVTTTILHDSGEEREYEWPVRVKDPTNSQMLGSATTYAKRYLLAAAFGVAKDVQDFEFDFDDDDDGEVNGLLNDKKKPDAGKSATPSNSTKNASGQPSGGTPVSHSGLQPSDGDILPFGTWEDRKEQILEYGLKAYLLSVDNVDEVVDSYHHWRDDNDPALTKNPILVSHFSERKASLLGEAA